MVRRTSCNSSWVSHGYSLVEMVAAVAILAILMLAMQSAVMLSVTAMPDNGSRASLLTAESRTLNRIAQDLHFASSVAMPDSRTLKMVVADQDGDGIDETITYLWDGTNGATLTRTRNAGAASVIASSVRQFQCQMRKKTIATQTTTYGSATGNEVVLASFNDYGISGTGNQILDIDNMCFAAEYFRFNTSAAPANATSIQITRASVWMLSKGILGSPVKAEIRRATGIGSLYPSSVRFGSQSSLDSGLLPLTLGWTDFSFNDVFITNPGEELELVISGTASQCVAQVWYQQNDNAPSDTPVFMWTTNAGGSWSPSGNFNRQDMKFTIYGRVTAPTMTTTTTTRYYLTGVDLRLCLGFNGADAVELSVSTPNQPEVAGP